MTHQLTILTGASRGMGLAMAQQLHEAGHTLLCISRTAKPALMVTAAPGFVPVEQWTHDLADAQGLCRRLEEWLSAMHQQREWAGVTLINNAGMIPHIAALDGIAADELARALRVGLEAPMLLSSAFLRATKGWPGQRKVLNISSGLGRRPMASQSAYCAAKAGLDHFTRCLALEQALESHGAKVCSLAPGVIDTDMQQQLRGADAVAFPDRDAFVKLRQSGALTSPADAAARVLAFLARPDFGEHPVADVRG